MTTTTRKPRKKPVVQPVVSVKVSRQTKAAALELAGGDERRLRTATGGWVVVVNNPQQKLPGQRGTTRIKA